MTGRYEIVLYNNKICYRLDVKRNITVLRGDSASGKSELIRLLGAYNSNPSSSGITLICEKKCTVLNEENWQLFTETYSDRIFFIDEGNGFLRTTEFADTVKRSDNYYIIISREGMPNLPYSIEEIYGLREGSDSGKYRLPKRIYNEMYRLYGNVPESISDLNVVVTEDSNSGNEFFSLLFPDKCISSAGKSNITKILSQHFNERVLAIVDGAAFGPEMQKCMELSDASGGAISVYAPESFEYLILQSGILEVPKSVLEETWNYADSAKYFSWEEFFTYYLSDTTRNTVSQYSKKKLNDFYKTAGNVKSVYDVLPESLKAIVDAF